MTKTQIIVFGSHGRVGLELQESLSTNKKAALFAAIDRRGRGTHKTLKEIKKVNAKSTVVIDFSSPDSFGDCLDWCVKNKVAMVSGTTGLTAKNEKAMAEAAKKIALLWSPNMSVGINLFLEMIEKFGQTFAQYDLQLEEFHHIHKKDSPSGTGKWLQQALESSTKKKLPAVLCGRGGGIFGIHKLWIMGEEETLTIEHTALNRRVFAQGALLGAIWLNQTQRKNGLYSIRDLFK